MGRLPPHFKDGLKRRIARRRGLDLAKRGKLKPAEVPLTPSPNNKTLVMRLIEAQFGVLIEALIGPNQGKEEEIGERLGITESTVSRWRLRLGLRTTSSRREEEKFG